MENKIIESEVKRITDFIKSQLFKAGFNSILVGLSGGIDSALVLQLCTLALGQKNVFAFYLPYKTSSKKSYQDAVLVAQEVGIKLEIIPITQMVDIYFKDINNLENLRRGNFCARIRMSVLFDKAKEKKALVAGTGNRSELLTGYCTIFGDSACSFEPIGHLFKTEVKQMAKFLNLPKQIIEKAPTADLWEGQTDEDEMGISYQTLDKILIALLDKKLSQSKLFEKFGEKRVQKVIQLVERSKFKREMPPCLDY